MNKIIITRGLPASGKTTWALQQVSNDLNIAVICKDDIRLENNNNIKESKVIEIRNQRTKEALDKHLTVIWADTNFNPIHELKALEFGKEYGIKVEIKEFDTPLEECIKRDNKRANGVGEKVITKMYNQYVKPPRKVYEEDLNLPSAIICDIDGTIAQMNGRSPYRYDKVDEDSPKRKIINLIKMFNERYKIIFVSGRPDSCREKTQEWLEKYFCYGCLGVDTPLLMRKTGDQRCDTIIKSEIFEEHIKGKYNIEYVVDDRNRVVEMWRNEGLTVLQVEEGDF